ncbi:hypothetical protein Ahy_B01g053016 isoform B [Arachis hypogaea]|jgi:hypothetical protein
MIAH